MKRILVLLLALSSCGIGRPRPGQYKLTEEAKILGKNWQIGCNIINNKMPGGNGKSYGVVSLYSRDQRPILSPLRLEKVWFYQADSLINTWDKFDQSWENLNSRSVRYYCRELGNEQHSSCDKAVLRFRNIYGFAYTLAIDCPDSDNVY